jgi:hypothetical protein
MKYLNYCNPHDIAVRLYFKKRFWYHGIPKIYLDGEVGTFGKLNFDFIDSVVSMTIYIKDRELILDAAHYAVMDFQHITDRMFEDEFSLPPVDTSGGSQAWL